MGSPSEWEREVYVTTQIRRFDKNRVIMWALPKEPNWRTNARIYDVYDRVLELGGMREIEQRLKRLEELEMKI